MTEDTGAAQAQPEGELAQDQLEQQAPDTSKAQPAKEGEQQQSSDQSQANPEGEQDREGQKKTPWFMDRIARQSAKLADQARKIEDYERRMAGQQQPDQRSEQQRQGDQRLPPDEIERRASQIAEQREFNSKLQQWDGKGRSEFPDFVDRCNAVANMGASERPEFMHFIADMEDGHKVVAHLADHPDDALRILNLPANRMAMELGRLSAKGFTPKPTPQSAAPPPIKPLAGSGRVETDPDKMSVEEWMKWREKQDA